MNFKLRAIVESWSWGNGINFFQQIPRREFSLGDRVAIASMQMESVTIGDPKTETRLYGTTEPLFALDRQDAQVLMDDLWQAGMRPSESAEGNSRLLLAKDAHITDLRAIAFKRLGIKEVK